MSIFIAVGIRTRFRDSIKKYPRKCVIGVTYFLYSWKLDNKEASGLSANPWSPQAYWVPTSYLTFNKRMNDYPENYLGCALARFVLPFPQKLLGDPWKLCKEPCLAQLGPRTDLLKQFWTSWVCFHSDLSLWNTLSVDVWSWESKTFCCLGLNVMAVKRFATLIGPLWIL